MWWPQVTYPQAHGHLLFKSSISDSFIILSTTSETQLFLCESQSVSRRFWQKYFFVSEVRSSWQTPAPDSTYSSEAEAVDKNAGSRFNLRLFQYLWYHLFVTLESSIRVGVTVTHRKTVQKFIVLFHFAAFFVFQTAQFLFSRDEERLRLFYFYFSKFTLEL